MCYHWIIWRGIDFMFSFFFYDFSIFRVFSPKTISVLKMLEYSTNSMLYYFKCTLANVGLHEA